MFSLFNSLTVQQTGCSLVKCQRQYKAQVALIKRENHSFSALCFFLKIFLQIAGPATENFPTIDSAVKRRRCDQKYIVMKDAEIPCVSSAHGDQSVSRLFNLNPFLLLLSMLEWLVIFKQC